jgi:hypothetical protein
MQRSNPLRSIGTCTANFRQPVARAVRFWQILVKVSVDPVVLDRAKLEPIFISNVSLLAPAKE